MASNLAPANKIFEEAKNDFLSSLSESERNLFSPCPSAAQLLKDVGKLDHITKDRSWGRRVLSHVKTLADALQPYFGVVEVMIQSDPTYSALVWGAFKMVFQLASNYMTFFEKLAKTLGRIAEVLPQYDQLAEISLEKCSERLNKSICKVYVDLLRFCQGVARVFTKKDGKAKRVPFVVTGLFWKPFDARFEDLLDDLRFHQDLVKSEILLAQMYAARKSSNYDSTQLLEVQGRLRAAEKAQAAKNTPPATEEARRALEKQQKDDTKMRFRHIQEWLAPPEFAQEWERARDLRESGTAQWLFDEDVFIEWVNAIPGPSAGVSRLSFGGSALWVQGNPGSGKTVLASSTVEELRDMFSVAGSRRSVFYFFFRSGIPTLQSPLAAYRSLLAQALHAQRDDLDLVDKFAFAMTEGSEGQLIASRYDLLELLVLCTEWLGETYFVLDGIDECEDPKVLVQDLLHVSLQSSVKTVFFGRPNIAALFKSISPNQQINIGHNNTEDIKLYLAKKLEEMEEDQLLPPTVDYEELISCLVTGADGMFIWARLMINYLNCPALTRKNRLTTILTVRVPEGLDSMYERIIRLICDGNRAEQDLAKRVFMWLLYSKRPMAVKELQRAIRLVPSAVSEDGDDDYDYADFHRTVVLTCAGLVERQNIFISTYGFEMASFNFIHLSAKEYLSSLSMPNVAQGIPPTVNMHLASEMESTIEMAHSCLLALSYHLPAQPLSGSLDRDTTPAEMYHTFPFCGYAAYYWLDHLGDIPLAEVLTSSNVPPEKFGGLVMALAQFLALKSALTACIEAMYVLRHMPDYGILQKWSQWMTSNKDRLLLEDPLTTVDSDCMELSRFLRDVQDHWGTQLLNSPKIIWEEAIAFTPSRLLAQTSDIKVDTLIRDAPDGPMVSTKCLTKISESSADGLYVAALSIWPSIAYEQNSQYSMRPVQSMLPGLCSDWSARYEVWSITSGPPRSVADIYIPLDADEIYLQMKRSLWQNDPSWNSGSFKVQFPLAISKNIQIMAVLRTVFLFTPAGEHEARLEPVALPLDFDKTLAVRWPAYRTESESAAELAEQVSKVGFRKSIRSFLSPDKNARGFRRSVSQGNADKANKVRFRSHSRSNSDFEFQGLDLYTYWISFSPDARYLFFLDNAPDKGNNVVVFEIEMRPRLKIVVAGYSISKPRAFDDHTELPQPEIVFHPQEPIVMYVFKALSASVFLWGFKDKSHTPSVIYSPTPWYTVEDIHFSNCGRYVVIREHNIPAPIIRPIDITLLRNPTLTTEDCSTARTRSDMVTTTPTSGPVIHVSAASTPKIITGGQTTVGHGGRSAGVHVVQSSTDISVRRWQGSGDNAPADVVQLTKLPNWGELKQSSATVAMPLSNDDAIRVVLNKTAKPWGDMSEPADVHLPLLISRDPNTLQSSLRAPDEHNRGRIEEHAS